MLRAALLFFVLALVSAIFGFGRVASTAVGLGTILFYVFLFLAVLSFIVKLLRR